MSEPRGVSGLIIATLVCILVFILCAYAGLIPREEIVRVGIISFGAFALLANLNRLAALSLSSYSVLVLLFLHTLNLCRDMTIFMDEPLFDTGRLPMSLLAVFPIIIVGWRGLLTGPGHAAIAAPVVYLGWAIIASGFGLDPVHSYFYGGWLAFMCVVISVSICLHQKPERFWNDWLLGLVCLGTFLSLASIIAIVFDAPGARYHRMVFDSSAGRLAEADGFSGIFVNPNTLASVSLLALGSAVGLAHFRQQRPYWLDAVLATCGIASLLSGSRASVIGLVMVCIAYLWSFYSFKSPNSKEASRKPSLASKMVPALLIVVLLSFAMSSVGRVGFLRLVHESASEMQRGEIGRDEIWKSFFHGMQERPVFGHGYMSRPMSADWETVRLMPGQIAKTSHSAPIEYGATTGILGLALFLWMLFGGLRGVFRPGYGELGKSAIVFWLCCSPIYLFYAHGNAPSAPAVWPLWILLLTCRSINGQHESGQVAPPWVLRISRQQEKEFRAALPPYSSEAFGEARRRARKAGDDSE